MDRIKRLSYEVLEKHKSKFGENFADNKKLLDDLAIIRSKGLKNEVAGYITKFIKSENYDLELNQSKAETSEDQNTIDEPVAESQPTQESEENIIEVGADSTEISETPATSEEKTE